MTKPISTEDLVGKTYGRLTFIEPVRKTPQGSVWVCRCSCGKTKEVSQSSVRSGNTRSCGCLRREQAPKNAKVVHGHNRAAGVTRTYTIWRAMLARCLNKNHEAYSRYGGAGITVCSAWLKDFSSFLKDMGEAPPRLSIDRVDGTKGYFLSNCRWATGVQQGQNKKTNVLLTYEGRTQCVSAWAREVGTTSNLISDRLKRGWSVEDAITKPLLKGKRHTA